LKGYNKEDRVVECLEYQIPVTILLFYLGSDKHISDQAIGIDEINTIGIDEDSTFQLKFVMKNAMWQTFSVNCLF